LNKKTKVRRQFNFIKPILKLQNLRSRTKKIEN